jgi:hypothetical protein
MMSNKPEQYTDVAATLSAAVKKGGGKFKLSTPGQAIRWRQRAYYYRKLLTKQGEPLGPLAHMTLRIEGDEPTTVIIEFARLVGTLTDFNDVPITPDDKEPALDDTKSAVDKILSRL